MGTIGEDLALLGPWPWPTRLERREAGMHRMLNPSSPRGKLYYALNEGPNAAAMN